MVVYDRPKFGEIPDSPRDYVLKMRPTDPGETDGLMSGADGVAKVQDFYGRWGRAKSLYGEVAAISKDPLAARLVSLETGLSEEIKSAIVAARDGFPWKAPPFYLNRIPEQQKALDAGLNRLDAGLNQYIDQIGPLLNETKDLIAKREAERAAAAIEAERAKKEAHVETTTKSQAKTTIYQANIASASTQKAQLQVQQVRAESELAAVVKKATRPKIFGIPLVVVAPIGIAGLLGAVLMLRKKR